MRVTVQQGLQRPRLHLFRLTLKRQISCGHLPTLIADIHRVLSATGMAHKKPPEDKLASMRPQTSLPLKPILSTKVHERLL